MTMTCAKRTTTEGRFRYKGGFSLLEVLFVLVIIGIVSAIALPMTKNFLKSYHLSAGVKAISGAIQSTRYLAIMNGYHFNLTLDPSSLSYQIASKPPGATSFTNVKNPIPWSATNDVSMTPSTTLEFYPGGTVVATTGSLTFTVTNGTNTETVTVSGVGNINVSP
jgi:prepilin-type N-terminal cleavage/methylation domain-containing protein